MAKEQIPVNIVSGVRPIPETIRAMVEAGFHVLSKDAQDPNGFLVESLFSFYGADVIDSIKRYLIEHENIPVVLNWPREGLGIPQVAVVTSNEDEDPSIDVLGDNTQVAGTGFYFKGVDDRGNPIPFGDGPITQREQKGYGENINIGVYVRAADPELCIYLSNVVRFLLFINKQKLTSLMDLHNMTLGIAEIAHDPQLFPEFAFTRQITVRGQTFFDINLEQRVVAALDIQMLVRDYIICAAPIPIPDAVKVPFEEE